MSLTANSFSIEEQSNRKHVGTPEFIGYLVAIFFYTNMTGMMGSFKNDYLINVLGLEANTVGNIDSITTVVGFFFSALIAMYIDSRSTGKNGKFRPLALLIAVPAALILVLSFTIPASLAETWLIIYLFILALSWGIVCSFGDSINHLAVVMSPNLKERDNVMSFRAISSAVGNSAPQVIILVLGFIFDDSKAMQYVAGSALCGVVGVITMLFGLKLTKERVISVSQKTNPILGFRDILKNKYAWVIFVSETLKNFRTVASYMGIFLAGALLGSTSKFLLFGLPTGIGTAVGMLIINFLLKKFNSKVLYIASGIYSLIINTVAFGIGYAYFKTENSVLQIVFIVALFLIGLQFGASNLLPTMFRADVLEVIELETGKRLDASLPFVIGIGTTISGAIAKKLAPEFLYGETALNIIGYIPETELNTNPVQSFETKVWLLFFYTVVHGIMMFLAGVPFFFYKLTGQVKEDIHSAVLAKREAYAEIDM